MSRFEINQTVVLIEALPPYGLPRGRLGVVIECFRQPTEAYEVEFVDEAASDILQLTLRPDQLEPYQPAIPIRAA